MKGNAPLFAAIDLGSNAFRMTIGQQVTRNRRVIVEPVKTLREPVRLAEGFQDMALDMRALERGWKAMERFGKRLRGFEEGRVRAVATSMVRQAENASTFLAEAEDRLGFRIEVISGLEEARLVYAGVAHCLPGERATRLVVDIGGGSTELIIGQGDRPLLAESIPIGSGFYSKRYFAGGVVSSSALQEAEWNASLEFEKAARHFRQHGWQQVIGSSGTARMLARVLRANSLNEGNRQGITYTGLLRLATRMLEIGHLRKMRLAGLQEHRIGTLPGGLAVMLAAFKVLGIDSMNTSEPGLRIGVLHGLMREGTQRA